MKTVQLRKRPESNWEYITEKTDLKNPLVLVFGNKYVLEDKDIYAELKTLYPDGHIIFGSSAGDITKESVENNGLVVTAVEFEKTRFDIKTKNVLNTDLDSFKSGQDLLNSFDKDGLRYVFVVSEGFHYKKEAIWQKE